MSMLAITASRSIAGRKGGIRGGCGWTVERRASVVVGGRGFARVAAKGRGGLEERQEGKAGKEGGRRGGCLMCAPRPCACRIVPVVDEMMRPESDEKKG